MPGRDGGLGSFVVFDGCEHTWWKAVAGASTLLTPKLRGSRYPSPLHPVLGREVGILTDIVGCWAQNVLLQGPNKWLV